MPQSPWPQQVVFSELNYPSFAKAFRQAATFRQVGDRLSIEDFSGSSWALQPGCPMDETSIPYAAIVRGRRYIIDVDDTEVDEQGKRIVFELVEIKSYQPTDADRVADIRACLEYLNPTIERSLDVPLVPPWPDAPRIEEGAIKIVMTVKYVGERYSVLALEPLAPVNASDGAGLSWFQRLLKRWFF